MAVPLQTHRQWMLGGAGVTIAGSLMLRGDPSPRPGTRADHGPLAQASHPLWNRHNNPPGRALAGKNRIITKTKNQGFPRFHQKPVWTELRTGIEGPSPAPKRFELQSRQSRTELTYLGVLCHPNRSHRNPDTALGVTTTRTDKQLAGKHDDH